MSDGAQSAKRGIMGSVSTALPNNVTTITGGYLLYSGLTSSNRFPYDVPWLRATALYLRGIGLPYETFRRIKPRGRRCSRR